ncbi:alpha-L-fucosidase [Pedobacter nutrimenti]|uniref:alpha-L-fucosidase n=1 Tax=Pedobacter nutrimenti TaxID=1241337 RepID=UPI00292F62ED|nr:alpha-L-fucosidase [Pedobacter nutrimenti]
MNNLNFSCLLKRVIGSILALQFFVLTAYGQTVAPAPYGPLPTKAQLNWQEMGMYAMVCFGLNTFTDKEWGYGDVDPALFNPSAFNAEQITATLKDAGFKGVLLVAKHHDGFCLWPTKSTKYSIAASPWMGGKGDLVKSFEMAARSSGLQFGIYVSPWDRNNPAYGKPAYIDIYRQQLREAYGHYGPLFISWYDGANGGDGFYGGAKDTRTIDRATYYHWEETWKMGRKLQPGAVIFSDIGPDIRWVGNEKGFADDTSWATFTPKGGKDPARPAPGDSRDEEAPGGHRDGKYWIPAECDVPLRPGWFYHSSQDNQVKSPYELFDIYFKSVGRGADLDLGVAPDRRGRLHENDVAALKGFGKLLKATFSVHLMEKATIKASNIRGGLGKYSPENLLDNNKNSYWATDDKVTSPEFTVRLNGLKRFNIIGIKEFIALGQRVESFAIDVWRNNKWENLSMGSSIGGQKLIRLPFFVTTDRIRVRILHSPVCPVLSEFAVFAEPDTLLAPVVTIGKDGKIDIRSLTPASKICFAVNAPVTAQSDVFRDAFVAPGQGVIRACCSNEYGGAGPVTTFVLPAEKKEWRVLSAPGAIDKSVMLIDGKEYTVWEAPFKRENPMLNAIVIDMGNSKMVSGFVFIPPSEPNGRGITDKYQIFTSRDGNNWEGEIAGEFSNIKANPLKQIIEIAQKRVARYIKFVPLRIADDGGTVRIAELGIY